MSTNLSDDHSPVTAAEEVPPPTKVAGDREVGPSTSSSTSSLGSAPLSNGGPNFAPPAPEGGASNGKADLSSSDDVDVTTTDSPEKKAPSGGGRGRPAERTAGERQGQHQQQSPHILPHVLATEPNIRERLRRLKQHVVNPLFKHSKSGAFKEPVNAKALGIYPIYHQIIKCPMDLGTVRKKIDRGEYATRSQCVDDIFLIWMNAKTFNAPGHFVHENAKVLEVVTRDKLAKLEHDEAAGVFDQPKLAGKKASEVPARLRDEPRPERRMSRKISTDLPGESVQPQQLKKKYVESLDEQMRQCDSILKELLTARLHQAYVEPFLQSSRMSEATGQPMDLYRVQQRLQAGYYRHPLQFASDFRSIISRAYRHAASMDDPVVQHASDLQHNFEILFSKVEFEPVANPAVYDRVGSREGDGGGMLRSLLAAQSQVAAVQSGVAGLLRDLVLLRRQNLPRRRRPGLQQPQQRGKGGRSLGARAPGGQAQKPRKRGRPPSAAGPGLTSPKAKKPRRQKVPQQLPLQPSPLPSAKSTLTEEQRLALRSEIASLKEDDQGTVVQIMMSNGEVLSQDANGYTEIDLGNCSARTIKLIQDYIKKVTTSSPARKRRRRQQNDYDGSSASSESSDEGEEEDDSSSSSSSVDSDSD